MASTALNGPGMQYPWYHGVLPTNNTPALTGATIDATGEKIAFSGRVWFQGRTGTKAIRKVGFLFGAVTKSGGSALTVSLQNVSTSAGPPMQPDETQDQTVAIANGDAGFTSNAWYQTGNLSADRTVSFGDQLSVVIEYDGSGRSAPDTVTIRGMTTTLSQGHMHCMALKTGTWAPQLIVPNVVLEFSDGTFGTLFGAFVCSNIGSHSYAVNTATTDEYALEMSWPGPVAIEGAGGWANFSTGGDAELILYTGTTASKTRTLDDIHAAGASANRPVFEVFDGVFSADANTTYRLGLRPTTTSNIALFYFDVAAAGHFQAHPGGTAFCQGTRLNQGAWDAPTTTRRPMLWVFVSAIDDGVSSGGSTTGGTRPLRVHRMAG